jgi:hypothetical protein
VSAPLAMNRFALAHVDTAAIGPRRSHNSGAARNKLVHLGSDRSLQAGHVPRSEVAFVDEMGSQRTPGCASRSWGVHDDSDAGEADGGSDDVVAIGPELVDNDAPGQ